MPVTDTSSTRARRLWIACIFGTACLLLGIIYSVWLAMRGRHFRDEHLIAILTLSKLVRLDISETSVTSAGIRTLSGSKTLNRLVIDAALLRDPATITALREIPKLISLTVHVKPTDKVHKEALGKALGEIDLHVSSE